MIPSALRLRAIQPGDESSISNLLFYEANLHRHLDWRSPLEWIGAPNYWALEEYGRVIAALACPEDPPNVAWIRLFGHQPQLTQLEAWSAMWEFARVEVFSANPAAHIASIATKQAFQNLLLASGFEFRHSIVLLEWTLERKTPMLPAPRNVRIRPMRAEDLPAVSQLDYESFGWFWHNTAECLRRAFNASIYATVAESDSALAGYQISTGSPRGAHLARLAILPSLQGGGIGSALLQDLFLSTAAQRVSVNTQHDNAASLALYKKMGFFRTGEHFPVLAYSQESLHTQR